MRARRVGLVLALGLLLLAACGPKVDLIETSAKDMNLTAGDLGAGYSLSTEQGLDELKASWDLPDDESFEDASFRMFGTEDGIVMAVVFALDRPVRSDELDELTESFEEGFVSEMPGTTLEDLSPPSLGDEATMTTADFPDLGVAMYFLGFRKVNVVGVVVVVGTSDMATEAFTSELGQKMAGKVK